jgi:hypothetical protein
MMLNSRSSPTTLSQRGSSRPSASLRNARKLSNAIFRCFSNFVRLNFTSQVEVIEGHHEEQVQALAGNAPMRRLRQSALKRCSAVGTIVGKISAQGETGRYPGREPTKFDLVDGHRHGARPRRAADATRPRRRGDRVTAVSFSHGLGPLRQAAFSGRPSLTGHCGHGWTYSLPRPVAITQLGSGVCIAAVEELLIFADGEERSWSTTTTGCKLSGIPMIRYSATLAARSHLPLQSRRQYVPGLHWH